MPVRDQLYVNFVGTWKGTLEYKDYQDSTRRVTLPTDRTVLQAFRVMSRSGGRNGSPLWLVLETEGSDDNRPATIRETVNVSASTVSVLKEMRITGGEFSFRHSYVFRRAQ